MSYHVGGSLQASASPSAWERDKRNRPGIASLPGGPILIEALVVTGVLVALATLAWHALAPQVYAEVVEDGVRMSTAESGRLFGIEVWFGIVTTVAGLVMGAWLMLRHRLEAVRIQILLVFAGIVGAVVVWLLGRSTGPGDPAARANPAEPGTMLEMPLDVESYALFAMWPLAAVVAGAIVIAITDRSPAANAPGPDGAE